MEHVKRTRLTLHERLSSIGVKYWTLVILLASIDVLGPLATDAHLPSLPQMTLQLNTSPSWIQFTILSYSFIMAISSLFGGLLSDHYGRRQMTIFGLFIFICGGFGCTFSSNILILNICRFIQGIGGGISSIITSSVARDVFLANERMKILGILGSIRPIGIAIAPMIGGWIAALHGWRMVFFITSLFALIITIFSLWLLPETKNKFFVNYNKIRMIRTETNIRGNIGILDESNYNLSTYKSDKISDNGMGCIVVDDDDDDTINDESTLIADDINNNNNNNDEWSPGIPMHAVTSYESGFLLNNNQNQNKLSDTSPSVVLNNNDGGSYENTINLTQAGSIPIQESPSEFNGYCKMSRIACSDGILMTVSWM